MDCRTCRTPSCSFCGAKSGDSVFGVFRFREEDVCVVAKELKESDIKQIIQIMSPLSNQSNLKRITNEKIEDQLLQFEQNQMQTSHKIGVLYCAKGQITEAAVLNNATGSPDFEEFLQFLGDKVKLSEWQGFMGGLSQLKDGTHSIARKWKDISIMFHVSTYLPYDNSDNLQIQKKKHIGNDCVNIIFKEDSTPISAHMMKSSFTHIYFVVQKTVKFKWNNPIQSMYCLKRCCSSFSTIPSFSSII